MLSNSQSKLIRSLQQKKYRDQQSLFVIEGDKIVSDFLQKGDFDEGKVLLLCATKEWLRKSNQLPDLSQLNIVESEISELKKVSTLVTPPPVLAVLRKTSFSFENNFLKEDMVLAFESLRDPGNLGTILRTADWFGFKHIICSKDSVDQYNSKVVQASMGAVLRVHTHYLDLEDIMEQAERMKIPIYGTTMSGENFMDTPIKAPGLILFGNESTGISEIIRFRLGTEIRIPDFPEGQSGTESLNVAISVAIFCSEARRRNR